MILFVFEGVKREPDLFRTIQRLYFANRDEQIVCSYNNNIYQLYKDSMPASKEDILQDKIFNSQLEQYVNTEDCKVAVLNAFPIFLFDYFK